MSGVTWTKQVSFAEALPLQKLVATLGDRGNLDLFPPGHGTGWDKCLEKPEAAVERWSRRKQQLYHFWHFNIETTSATTAENETINVKTRIKFPIHPASHFNPSPGLLRSTTELNLVTVAKTSPDPLETRGPRPSFPPHSGPVRRDPGKAPRNSAAKSIPGRARAEGTCGDVGGSHSICTDTRGRDFIMNPNYLVPEPSKCKRPKSTGASRRGAKSRDGAAIPGTGDSRSGQETHAGDNSGSQRAEHT